MIIEGAEIFIGIEDNNRIYYMTNNIWQSKNKEQYESYVDSGVSRHKDFENYVHVIPFKKLEDDTE